MSRGTGAGTHVNGGHEASAVSISERQLAEDLVVLQLAAAVAHRSVGRGLRVRAAFTATIAAVGGLSLAATSLNVAAAVLALLATLVVAFGLDPFVDRLQRRAVLIQEEFDTALFGLPWNVGLAPERVSQSVISTLSASISRRDSRAKAVMEGWYSGIDGLEPPSDVLMCQRQNLHWDVRVRRIYQGILGGWVVAWVIAGLSLGASTYASAEGVILSWLLPGIPASSVAVEALVRQSRVEQEKRRLLRLVDDRLGSSSDGKDELLFARMMQDGILTLRLQSPRAPHVVYRVARWRDPALRNDSAP